MTAILGLSYSALQAGLPDASRDYIQKVHGAAGSLLGIINDILDFSKAETGKMRLENETFALAEVLDRVVVAAGVEARSKGLEFRLEIAPSVPALLRGDALRLSQILMNLCANAVHFTKAGSVVVEVTASSKKRRRLSWLSR